MKAYFGINNKIYKDDKTIILVFLKKMSKRRGSTFVEGWYLKLINKAIPEVEKTFKKLCEAFEKTFIPKDIKDRACQTIYSLSIVMILFPHHSILLIIHSRCLLTWRGRGSVCFLNTTYLLTHRFSTFSVAHALPTMVVFFLFLFAPLFAAFLLTIYVALCKPGCAVSAADTSSV